MIANTAVIATTMTGRRREVDRSALIAGVVRIEGAGAFGSETVPGPAWDPR